MQQNLIGQKFKNRQGLMYTVVSLATNPNDGKHYIVEFESGYQITARLDKILLGTVIYDNKSMPIDIENEIDDFVGYKGVTRKGDPFEVVSYAGKPNRAKTYNVKFLNTGSIKAFEKGSIKKGLIRDPKNKSENILNYEGVNTQGEKFKVIELAYIKDGNKLYSVKFEDTNYIGQFYKYLILKGKIYDPYYPSIYGNCCLGLASSSKDSEYFDEYVLWRDMIARCYNPKHISYRNYGAKGVTVCDRWRCFEYFLEDLPKIENYDKWKANHTLYQLDKDKKQNDNSTSNKIYSIETCVFISKRDNTIERNIRAGNKSGYIGVNETVYGTFRAVVNGDHYGTFYDPIAAANMYNHVAIYRGYPEEYLNQNIPYMSRLECGEYRTKNKSALTRMAYIVDKQRYADKITSENDLIHMIKIVNANKYYNIRKGDK